MSLHIMCYTAYVFYETHWTTLLKQTQILVRVCVFGIPSLRDTRVPNYVVQADVAACLHPISCKEEGHARYVLNSVPLLV